MDNGLGNDYGSGRWAVWRGANREIKHLLKHLIKQGTVKHKNEKSKLKTRKTACTHTHSIFPQPCSCPQSAQPPPVCSRPLLLGHCSQSGSDQTIPGVGWKGSSSHEGDKGRTTDSPQGIFVQIRKSHLLGQTWPPRAQGLPAPSPSPFGWAPALENEGTRGSWFKGLHQFLFPHPCYSEVPATDPKTPVSYTHLTLPTKTHQCRSRWSPYH